MNEVLTADVLGNDDFMTSLGRFSKTAEEFSALHALYKTTSKFQRKISKLKDSIKKEEQGLLCVKEQLIGISSIRVSLSTGLTLQT